MWTESLGKPGHSRVHRTPRPKWAQSWLNQAESSKTRLCRDAGKSRGAAPTGRWLPQKANDVGSPPRRTSASNAGRALSCPADRLTPETRPAVHCVPPWALFPPLGGSGEGKPAGWCTYEEPCLLAPRSSDGRCGHWPSMQAFLQATAETRAAPRPLPSSDWRKVISQLGVSLRTTAWNRSLKLRGGAGPRSRLHGLSRASPAHPPETLPAERSGGATPGDPALHPGRASAGHGEPPRPRPRTWGAACTPSRPRPR